jgi:hypothetical protein
MTRRYALLILSASLGACLVSGCLRLKSDEDHFPDDYDWERMWFSEHPSATQPEIQSNYQVRLPDAQPGPSRSGSGLVGPASRLPSEGGNPAAGPTAVERVALEVKPAELPSPVIAKPAEPAPPPPVPPEPPLIAALRCVLDKHPAEALELLQHYDKPNQDLLLALLPLAAHIGAGDLERATPQEMAAVLEQLNAVAQALRPRAALALDKQCFCREILTFGVYDPLPSDYAFHAGCEGRPGERVRVYVEVRNFTNRPRGTCYETALAGTLEILDFNNQVAARLDFPATPDRSLTPRQDYFLKLEFNIPREVPPGAYTLRIQVRDQNAVPGGKSSPRVARCSLDFQVIRGGAHRDPSRGEGLPTE